MTVLWNIFLTELCVRCSYAMVVNDGVVEHLSNCELSVCCSYAMVVNDGVVEHLSNCELCLLQLCDGSK